METRETKVYYLYRNSWNQEVFIRLKVLIIQINFEERWAGLEFRRRSLFEVTSSPYTNRSKQKLLWGRATPFDSEGWRDTNLSPYPSWLPLLLKKDWPPLKNNNEKKEEPSLCLNPVKHTKSLWGAVTPKEWRPKDYVGPGNLSGESDVFWETTLG